MSSLPDGLSVAAARGRPLCALLAAIVLAGCGAGGLPSPSAGATAPDAPSVAAPPSPAPVVVDQTVAPTSPATPAATDPAATDPAEPPAAGLTGPTGELAAGALGSYVWGGAGSDSPWIVPPADHAVRVSGPYTVTFDPPLTAARWRAAWAPVDGVQAGDPTGAVDGGGGPILVDGPGAPGTWSLKVDVRFGDGDHAVWYWRLVLAP